MAYNLANLWRLVLRSRVWITHSRLRTSDLARGSHHCKDHLKVAEEQLALSITCVWWDQTVVGGRALPRAKNKSSVYSGRAKVILELQQLLP